MLAIQTRGLTHDYGGLRAVDHLELEIPQGSVYALLGPNGAGKTTTLHLLLGLLRPSAGQAMVAGADPATQGTLVRSRCGALLEHAGLYERLTAQQNLRFFGRLNGMAEADLGPRIQASLTDLGLWDRRDEPVGTWSRGMKQRLAIARAMLHRPQVLFLDEPTAGFDPAAAAHLRDQLRTMARQEGLTVVLTTHNLHEAQELCDAVAVIRKGRLLAAGPPTSLRGPRLPVVEVTGSGITAKVLAALRRNATVAAVDEPAAGRLRITLHAGSRAAPIVRALVDAGVDVEEVRPVHASLEEDVLAILEGPA